MRIVVAENKVCCNPENDQIVVVFPNGKAGFYELRKTGKQLINIVYQNG